jgi:tetratricopeptide (TPR) repeat protein
MRAAAIALAGLGLYLAGCGADRPSHAAIDSMGVDAETRAGFGPASARVDAASGVGSIEQHRDTLTEKLNDAEAQWRAAPDQPNRALRVARLRSRLDNLDVAYARYRDYSRVARTSLRSFLGRFAPALEWEADYAFAAGDLSLASSIVRDVIIRLHRQETTGRAGASPSTADSHAARLMAAEAFLDLGRLAEEQMDFQLAMGSYALAVSHSPGSPAAHDADEELAKLKAALGRAVEAQSSSPQRR